jgi:hypothetical protein
VAKRKGLRRRPARLQPRKRVLVVCEGEVTEPGYLNAIRVQYRTPLVDVRVVGEGEDPKAVVERAIRLRRESFAQARARKDENCRFEEVWCVVDVDEHILLPDAKQQARDNGVEIVVSSPCFELWILLHFQDQSAYIDRGAVQAACRRYIPGFQKEVPCERVLPFYENAVSRARKLDEWHESRGTEGENPSTRVYALTERIRELGTTSQLKRIKEYQYGSNS